MGLKRVPKGDIGCFAVQLPLVCRQLYIDTSLLIFSESTLLLPFEPRATCKAWISDLDSTKSQAIRTIHCWVHEAFRDDVAGSVPSLQSLVAMHSQTMEPEFGDAWKAETVEIIQKAQSRRLNVSLEYFHSTPEMLEL